MKPKSINNLFTLMLLALIWGSSFILYKKALLVFTPVEVVSMRLSLSALALLPFWIQGAKHIPRKDWKYVIQSGYIGNGIPVYLFAVAVSLAASGVVGTLNSLTPLFSLTLGMIFYGYPFRWMKVSGVLLALIGASFLVLNKGQGNLADHYLAGILAVVATIFYGWNSLLTKKNLSKYHSKTVSAGALLSVGIPAFVVLLFTDALEKFQTNPDAFQAFGFTAILSLGGTAMALILYNRLIAKAGAIYAASVAYLMPLVAILWGWADGETILAVHLLGFLSILLGIGLLNYEKEK
jgi:drug/metabolite transporter (DMT)-like permease